MNVAGALTGLNTLRSKGPYDPHVHSERKFLQSLNTLRSKGPYDRFGQLRAGRGVLTPSDLKVLTIEASTMLGDMGSVLTPSDLKVLTIKSPIAR